MKFGPSYFKTGNYSDYSERRPRYLQTARELHGLFESLRLVQLNDSILDFGCGLGFLADGLVRCGYKNVVGYDSSKWASKQAKRIISTVSKPRKSDCMIALDVFEHLTDNEVLKTLKVVCPDVLVSRIPVAIKRNGGFALQVSRNDKTHINCKTAEEWISVFIRSCGFSTVLRMNLHTIYDSPGVACLLAIR